MKEYNKLKLTSKCWHCLGCQCLENPYFEGVTACIDFRQCDKVAWCANETIDHWVKTGKIKKD